MTSEINRFIKTFIVEQNNYFKKNVVTSNEIRDLYNRKVKKNYNEDNWENSYLN